MPVTAKLSRRFYEALGDDVVNELVDWLNAMDATYKLDLRELNDLNFARFEAKLDQRFAEADAKWEQRLAEFGAKLRTELEIKMDQRFATIDQRFEKVDVRLGSLEASLERVRADVIKWNFVFWMGMVVTIFAARLV